MANKEEYVSNRHDQSPFLSFKDIHYYLLETNGMSNIHISSNYFGHILAAFCITHRN